MPNELKKTTVLERKVKREN